MLLMDSMPIEQFSEYADNHSNDSQFYYLIQELRATKLLLDGDEESSVIEFNKLISNPLVTSDIKNRASILIKIAN